jgi:phytanoyl-CoA dioxygenase PhyH
MGAGAEQTTLLSDEQLAGWDRDGFIVIDVPAPIELLDDVLSEVEPLYHDEFHPGPTATVDGVVYTRHPVSTGADEFHWQRIKEAWKLCDSVRALALSPQALATVEQLHGRKVMPFQTLNFPVGTQQPAHADSMAFQSDPAGFMCGLWVALEDMDMDNGPLIYYPGSHKLPVPTWDEIDRVTGRTVKREDFDSYDEFMQKRSGQYQDYCDALVPMHDLQPAYGTIRKGQALIWSSNLLHGGSKQNDPSRTRHSQVTHYFFEDTRVFTPMRNEGSHIYYDYPEWIRDPVPSYTPAAVHSAVEGVVPEDATVIMVTRDEPALLELARNTLHLPIATDGSLEGRQPDEYDQVAELQRLRDEQGAGYVVLPKTHLWALEFRMTALQEHLENEHRCVLRDGAYCAVYEFV